jgi:hypothetical protein
MKSLKDIANNFDKQRIPGIKSIKKYPSIDGEKFKTYGGLFLQKYFINTGTKPNKMVSFGAKDKSFANPIIFIIYDLKMQPGVIFEFKKDLDTDKFLNFVGKFFSKAKFIIPKNNIKEDIEFDKILKEGKGEVISQILSKILIVLPSIVGLMVLAHYYFTQLKYAKEEMYVNTTLEKKINTELFQGQQKNESAFKLFSNLENYLQLVINKKINALILCGPPGMSKTYMVRRTLHFSDKKPGKDYNIEKGSSLGLNSVYQLLYNSRDKLLILDDFDTPLENNDVVNLIKAVTDSYGNRIVSLPPEKVLSSQDSTMSAAPSKFEFKGQIIIITNKKKNDIDLALRSRAPAVEVFYNSKEVISAMDALLKFIAPQIPYDVKLEAFNYIKLLIKNDPHINVSFRSVKAVIDARVGNPEDWKEMAQLVVEYKGKPIKENLITKTLNRFYS